ncbi:hypothetical protein [Streptomyces sp. G-G2]|uniref:hypothetical protein n=1 Tax=Streptomyces sp. G-G2 TaxID=3046201 RepID=UPI0024B8B504|nr:hypothetical protein [Streptomyces sp. G-G2]MDJ0385619.1 hypothetical protein [Streptomyces sp. G-G2]
MGDMRDKAQRPGIGREEQVRDEHAQVEHAHDTTRRTRKAGQPGAEESARRSDGARGHRQDDPGAEAESDTDPD